ncbi:uncharacterized protein LOC106096088 [Stomoxys calcitrans]|uniref:uncharacterized protein LOC106096088 n=1 Tax=Stomoxys calcitrans TaxID=35570 RepID=UPI0027E278E7|nr:uncharacterized protein LOC106096088 [Stomoxys calcitrans]
MLNGKFFTGLPPKMIERGGGEAVPNRLQSHFFWPDDSKVESAVETRLRRRNSVQLQESAKPSYGKQMSIGDNDVDTRKRFTKEFSQSSIQFYDNLNDNDSTDSRRTLPRSRGPRRAELTEKPTATKLQLPETIVDEAYTAAKRKQAYMSKIEFYDYVNENDTVSSNRNNLRKPKMDMNDKREMERNTKNSPKLQIKRDVRSLSEEKEIPKVNNRDVQTLERPRPIKEVNVNKTSSRGGNNRQDMYQRINISPHTSSARPRYEEPYEDERDHKEQDIARRSAHSRYASDQETYHKPNNSVLKKDRGHKSFDRELEDHEDRHYFNRKYDEYDEEPQYRSANNDTSYRNRRAKLETDDYEEDIGSRMKTVRIQSSPPRKHQYYRDDYDDDETHVSHQRNRESPTRERTHHGNTQRHTEYRRTELYEVDSPCEDNDEAMNNKYSGSGGNSTKSRINRVSNKLNNEVQRRRNASPSPGPATKSRSPANPSRNAPAATSAATNEVNKPRKHLRSSLCFHDGAIIAENDATLSPTSQKPTAAPRRNIRSSATKRVSVGLPD